MPPIDLGHSLEDNLVCVRSVVCLSALSSPIKCNTAKESKEVCYMKEESREGESAWTYVALTSVLE